MRKGTFFKIKDHSRMYGPVNSDFNRVSFLIFFIFFFFLFKKKKFFDDLEYNSAMPIRKIFFLRDLVDGRVTTRVYIYT